MPPCKCGILEKLEQNELKLVYGLAFAPKWLLSCFILLQRRKMKPYMKLLHSISQHCQMAQSYNSGKNKDKEFVSNCIHSLVEIIYHIDLSIRHNIQVMSVYCVLKFCLALKTIQHFVQNFWSTFIPFRQHYYIWKCEFENIKELTYVGLKTMMIPDEISCGALTLLLMKHNPYLFYEVTPACSCIMEAYGSTIVSGASYSFLMRRTADTK